MYVRVYMYACVCVYVFMYMYICMYTDIYVLINHNGIPENPPGIHVSSS